MALDVRVLRDDNTEVQDYGERRLRRDRSASHYRRRQKIYRDEMNLSEIMDSQSRNLSVKNLEDVEPERKTRTMMTMIENLSFDDDYLGEE